MKKSIITTAILGAIIGVSAVPAAAQGYTGAALELLKEKRLWFNSSNAAGSVFDNKQNYSDLSIGYDVLGGNFKRPQQGRTQTDVKINCEGFMDLNSAYVWGKFSFDHRNVDEAGYNASVADPFRGLPLYIVDPYQSDWRNQYYDMSFRAATPLYWGKLALGIEGTYKAALAAKQRDPRVDTRYFELELIPGVAYEFLPGHRLGADFRFTSVKEDSRMENANSQIKHDYYVMYGLGFAEKKNGEGSTTNYHGTRYGGALQYNFGSEGVNLLVEGRYSRRVENADASYSNPRKDAAADENLLDGNVNLQFTGKNFSNFFKANFSSRNIKGIQYVSQHDNSGNFEGWVDIFRSVRSKYKTRIAELDYSLLRNRADEYAWRVDAGMRYTKLDDIYLKPASEKNSENLYMHVDTKINFELDQVLRRRLLATLGYGYNKNLSGKYVYNGPNPDYITVTEIEAKDEDYLTTNWYNLRVALEYSQQISQVQKTNAYGRVSFDYSKAMHHEFNQRSYVSVAVGVNF